MMKPPEQKLCTAFEEFRCIASGELARVALKTKEILDRKERGSVLIFDDESGEQIELDFRGTAEDVLKRLPRANEQKSTTAPDTVTAPRGRGRPKLGVVPREVTLLPRHWEWLNDQPGGASVALRKLVEQARLANTGKDRIRRAQESTYRFMSALAGNLPGFEEATRALFAANQERFNELVDPWPADVRDHVRKLATGSF
jgi:hypothetical protein